MSHDFRFAEYLYDQLGFVNGLNRQNIACRVLNRFCILPKGLLTRSKNFTRRSGSNFTRVPLLEV